MSNASSLLAAIAAFGVATSATGFATSPATGALLIEGVFDDRALRIVVDTENARADVMLGDDRHVLDLEAGEAHRIETNGTARAARLSTREAAPRPEIKPWGPGPSIAGHASVYHVMTLGEKICGELLISPWMKPFVEPAVEAMSILERIKGEGGIGAAGFEGACSELPFSSYALAGWPLMAGSIDQPILRTNNISFDYEPRGDELGWRH